MITPLKHQIKFSALCWELLKTKGYVYLAGKPRSGKTYTAILTAEKSTMISSVLVLTKKAAISGWHIFIVGNTALKHKYYVTNYEQAHKLKAKDYDLVIIDESHNLGTLAKPSNRILTIKKLCRNMPHIHLSGTAIVESPCGIFHQMYISKYNPFKFKNFYDFHRFYGEPYYIKIAGREINQYDKCNKYLMDRINEFTVYMTQEDAGIPKELQTIDKIHYIKLDTSTKQLYNHLQEHQIATVSQNILKGIKCPICGLHLHVNEPEVSCPTCGFKYNYKLVCDTNIKLRTSLHMLESGVVKVNDEYIELGNTEKIDYILKEFGDNETVGIMCHFVGERKLVAKHFKRAKIYSSTAHAEGVDLSHLSHFIIMSSSYSGSKFIQRKERIVNINGSNTLTVHHLLVKGAISEQVYKKTSKKEDFNNSTYVQESL